MPSHPPTVPQFTLRPAILHFRKSLLNAQKSPRTVETYSDSVERFTTWLAEQEAPQSLALITASTVQDWITSLREKGNSEGTAFNRYNGLKAFFRWALSEELIESNPMAKVPVPKVPVAPIPALTEDQVRALFKTVKGKKSFDEIRDNALLRLLVDTGCRRAEIVNLRGRMLPNGSVEGDVDLDHDQITVRGKGNKTRIVPFGDRTSDALWAYFRKRATHRLQASPALWLGPRGGLTANGLLQAVRRRGRQAGIPDLFTHQLRHTWATLMLSTGMHESDIVRLAGWKDHEMLNRYTAHGADERARAAYRTVAPGDRL